MELSTILAVITLLASGFGIKWYFDRKRLDKYFAELKNRKLKKRTEQELRAWSREIKQVNKTKVEYDKAIKNYRDKYGDDGYDTELGSTESE